MALVHVCRHEEQAVARLHLGERLHLLKLLGREELRDRALQLALLRPGDVAESLAAVLLHEVLALVEPRAGLHAHDALDEQALDEAAVLHARGERLEVGAAEEVAHVEPLERVAEVRLVGAVDHHRVAVLDARPRGGVALPGGELREGLPDDVLHDGEDLVLRGVGHLDVELVELARRAVRARGLVAEARRDLEVLVEARDHEELLEHLRRLRKGVEHAAVDAARHEVVARALGRGGREDGRLVLVEALGPHLLAQEADHLGTQDDVVVQLFAAEVEEAVLEAHLLALLGLFVRDVERRDAGDALHHELVRLDLDFAGGQVVVDRLGVAELHLARHGDDAFKVRLLDEAEEAAARVHDDLGDAVVVAQVHEEDAAVVAQAEHPAGEPDGLAGVLLAELVAGMRSVGMHVHSVSLLSLFGLRALHGGGLLP